MQKLKGWNDIIDIEEGNIITLPYPIGTDKHILMTNLLQAKVTVYPKNGRSVTLRDNSVVYDNIHNPDYIEITPTTIKIHYHAEIWDYCRLSYVYPETTTPEPDSKPPLVSRPTTGIITDILPNGDVIAHFDKDTQIQQETFTLNITVQKNAASKKGITINPPCAEGYEDKTVLIVNELRTLTYGTDFYWSKSTQLQWNDSAGIKQRDKLQITYWIDKEAEVADSTDIIETLGGNVDITIPQIPPREPEQEPEPLVDVPKGKGIDYTSSLRPRISEYMKKYSVQRTTSLDINVDEKPKVSFDGVELEEDYDVWEKFKRVTFKLNNGEVVISGDEKLKGAVSPGALDDVECGRHTLRIILASGYADFYIDVIPYSKYKIADAEGEKRYEFSVTVSNGKKDDSGDVDCEGNLIKDEAKDKYDKIWREIPKLEGYEKFSPYNSKYQGTFMYNTTVSVETAEKHQKITDGKYFIKYSGGYSCYYIKCSKGGSCPAYQGSDKTIIARESKYAPTHYHTYVTTDEFVQG